MVFGKEDCFVVFIVGLREFGCLACLVVSDSCWWCLVRFFHVSRVCYFGRVSWGTKFLVSRDAGQLVTTVECRGD